MSTLSDAFLRLQLRVVREEGQARLMLVEGDRADELVRRIEALAEQQGLSVTVELGSTSLSIVEAPAAAAYG